MTGFMVNILLILAALLLVVVAIGSVQIGASFAKDLFQAAPPIAVAWLRLALAAALLIGTYDGYYGPGTGTFLMLVFIHLGKMDTRHAAGGAKLPALRAVLAAA